MSNAKIGVALVGGYLLGRTKKAKMAIGLGMFLAGKKLNLDPKQLGTLIANSPVLGPLNDQVRKELVDATKAAAGTALTQRMSGLADSLHERTAALTEGSDAAGDTERVPEDEAPRAGADGEDRAPEGEARGDAGNAEDAKGAEGAVDAEEEDAKPAPRRRKSGASTAKPADSANSAKSATTSAAKSSAKSAKKTGAAAARRPAASASRASGKTAAASSRGRPAASSGRKAASGARKKASGAARTAADRGGSNG
ncbi:hypothetical protein [Streptomyces sp. NEAU-S7GS2]|uniref:hypothetical protein n=1 Tax=Streptomyces sp. NEAU-S7GS2 TaxID=2202000 RepID=UPI0019504B38|nr:hypothetical protein [Streptomyces sp. NEAU-S7GS2]